MYPIALIASNFVRENRWPLITLLAYVLAFGGAMAFVSDASLEDTLFLLRSVGVYGLAFTGLLAAAAINNERRSRRILAVLSKGIERSQYLAGLLAGVMLDAIIYAMAIGGVGTFALVRHGQSPERLWQMLAILIAAFLLAATAALFFSTFLHPLMAAAAAAITLATMGAVGRMLGGAWSQLLPVYTLADAMVSFGLPGWHAPWTAAGWAVLHAMIFATLATVVFSRRDIAVAVE